MRALVAVAASASRTSSSSGRQTRGRTAVDGQDALHRAVRADHRNAEVRGVAGREHRVRISDPRVVPDVGDRPRRARLHDVADEPGSRGRARTDRLTLPVTGGRAPDDLVALEQPNRGASGLEQLDGRAYGDVEQVVRVELAGELDAGTRKPLRKRAGTSLALVQLASLERAAGCTRDVARELELLVAEHRLAAEEDDHQREARTGRLDERNREQRVAICRPRPLSRARRRSDCRRGAGARRAPSRREPAPSGPPASARR